MKTEDFIRDAAARGWSKTQTREALGLCRDTFWAILRAMPELEWPKRGCSLGNKLGNASRAPSEAVVAAAARARAARRERILVAWQGRTGTIAELAAFSPASERTIRRRISAGMPAEEAFSTPPSLEMPMAKWRKSERGSHAR